MLGHRTTLYLRVVVDKHQEEQRPVMLGQQVCSLALLAVVAVLLLVQ